MRWIFLTFLFVALVGTGIAAPSQSRAQAPLDANPCAPPNYRIDTRPDPDGPPTNVTIGMVIADLLDVSDVDQTITVDIITRMSWTDERLANWEGCKLPISSIWFPELILKNSGRIFKRWPETVSVEEGGRVTYNQRFAGSFSTYHNLVGYPFDPLDISLRFYPLDWSIEKLVFTDDTGYTGTTPLLNISDWRLNGVEASVVSVEFDSLEQTRAGYELRISVERYVSYFVWKIIMPISLIVVMSWMAFWIDPSQFGTQIGLSTTSVLTMVAFIFATTNMLPRLGYFTMLDKYVAWSTIFVFAALLQSLSTGYLTSIGRTAPALRLDRVSRVLFPAAFVLVCALLFSGIG